MTPFTEAERKSFDYAHSGTDSRPLAERIVIWLKGRGYHAALEESGDLNRVYVEEIVGYFWPEDDTEDRWIHAV